ncbi:hypothetical protein [Neptunicella sp. SCSIO 80796]|uniref:hypothetical protein n=1 Tax=Neptunicella plasticusilytica TaxID=3117012 RepID=UPI003A4E4A85
MLKFRLIKPLVVISGLCALTAFGTVTATPPNVLKQPAELPPQMLNQLPNTEAEMVQAVFMLN